MDISSIIVMSIVIIILVSMLVFSIELFLPIQLKFEMNGICRSYIYKIESDGYLSLEDQTELKDALLKIGLSDPLITINAKGTKYGDRVDVSIASYYRRSRINRLFSRSEDRLEFKYERTFFIRHISN